MKIKNLIDKGLRFVKHNKPLILTVGIMVSMTASLYSVAKTTLEVEHILDSDIPKSKKRFKIVKKSIVPASIVAATYILIIYNYITNKKIQTSLVMAAVSSRELLENYRIRVREEKGEKEEEYIYAKSVEETSIVPMVLDPSKKLFLEPISMQFFEATVEDVVLAEYELNRLFRLRGEVSFNDWLAILGIETREDCDMYGWSEYAEPVYGYSWVDFVHSPHITNDGKEYLMITYPFLPHYDYQDPYDETVGDKLVYPKYGTSKDFSTFCIGNVEVTRF